MTEVSGPEESLNVESHFGFRETPFGVTPDPRFFYNTPVYLKSLAKLSHAIKTKKGLIVITGEVGMGKTILLRKLMRDLQSAVKFIFVSCSHLHSHRLPEIVAKDLGIAKKNRFELAEELRQCILEQVKNGRTVALILDESQNLSDRDFEDLCSLSNLETDDEKLLQIVLAGQPELITRLSKTSLRQVRQRVAIQLSLSGLETKTEVEHYIRHRLQVADYDGPEIFTEEAVEAIWQYSLGTPRLVNVICDKSLALLCETGAKNVAAHLVMNAASEFQLNKELPIPDQKNSEAIPVRPTTVNSNAQENGFDSESERAPTAQYRSGFVNIPSADDQASAVSMNLSKNAEADPIQAPKPTQSLHSENKVARFGESFDARRTEKHSTELTESVKRTNPTRFQKRIGLKWKIAGAFSVLTLILSSFLGFGLYHFTQQTLSEQIEKRSLAIGVNLADASAGHIVGNDLLSLNTVLRKYTFRDGVAYAFFQNNSGAIVAHTLGEFPLELREGLRTDTQRVASRRETSFNGKAVYETAVPVLDGQLGTIHVGFWKDAMTRELQRGLLPVIGIIAIMAVLGTLMSIVMAHWIARPITRLTQVAERITRGDLQSSAEYPKSRDEIGELARSLERMRVSLKAAMSRLGHESL